ncbi:hypothetical protein TREMEDRAFT_63516 [Tremella mesenterica DSM 1558]|uniref:uncharacterized protein n=1 Tax=Tremella mesenterica (strain ATCC 24925 / CBS 8224 / DSM 1558 / NBRC 9311 / NRRL Y-6157 / RJB 2259-6 / UBC 559-6) TaxID=578456 RepID=UPI0003F48F69|nr:uncharacterized protein TREMEDRAFT_63516 [Tremella mesenterica DSM 1558]EIW68346.1 hypothetical protein TREMEDRAFT_63516 [Tremella mesenterica DSM 1558]
MAKPFKRACKAHNTTNDNVENLVEKPASTSSSQSPVSSQPPKSANNNTTNNNNNNGGGGGGGGGDGDGMQVGLAYAGRGGSIAPWKSLPGSKLSWYYTWSATATSNDDGLEFIPMVWGEKSLAGLTDAEKKWPAGTKYVLSFNEPEIQPKSGGSDMSAQDGAKWHQQWVSSLSGKYQICSPAVTRGGKTWMQDWLKACDGKCQYDLVCFHYYGTDATDLISYAKVRNVSTTFSLPRR